MIAPSMSVYCLHCRAVTPHQFRLDIDFHADLWICDNCSVVAEVYPHSRYYQLFSETKITLMSVDQPLARVRAIAEVKLVITSNPDYPDIAGNVDDRTLMLNPFYAHSMTDNRICLEMSLLIGTISDYYRA